jgi:amino acid transporter
LVGRVMSTDRLEGELLPKRLALPIFASDALSSVAYATEAALAVLVAASLSSRGAVIPVSIAIALLLVVVVASYRQTIHAYPRGGGAYIVARENLGSLPGLVAAASLLIDYVLTVAVSIAAGSLAITSAAPALTPYLLPLSLGFLALLLLANLRGLRESGFLFAMPTYLFIGAMSLLILVGLSRGFLQGWPQATVPDPVATGTAASVGLVVLLRAFASGSSALTGVEAIANGVSAFRRPQDRNAANTLVVMGFFAVAFFLGVSVLAWKTNALPSGSASVLSEVARASFGGGAFGDVGFYIVQFTTFAVLVLAANTAFQGFPRLSAIVAEDGYAPRQLQNLGDRLVFSNGIVLLSVLAGLLLVIYRAQVDQLIHLYLLGVFTAFTLSQAGMVRFWLRRRREGESWRAIGPKLVLNTLGAMVTALVAIIVMATKFSEGAWIVMLAVPLMVGGFVLVRRHYRSFALRLSPIHEVRTDRTDPGRVLLFVENLDQATRMAFAYARAISHGNLEALHVPGSEGRLEVARRWGTFSRGNSLRQLHFRDDPADSVIDYLRLRPRTPGEFTTVVIPEEFHQPSHLEALRRRSSYSLKRRLLREPGIVITDVPVVDGIACADLGDERLSIEVILPVASVTDPTMRALEYALSLPVDVVRAVHIVLGEAETKTIEAAWAAAGAPVALEIISSPYRDLGAPLLELVRATTARPGTICNVVMPEAVLLRRRHRILHNQRAFYLKRLLLFEKNTIVTSVPYQVE